MRFKASSVVTPGIPPTSETVRDNRLTGIYTPVNTLVTSTRMRVKKPDNKDKKARLTGLLFFESL